jgi:hypothetical protein
MFDVPSDITVDEVIRWSVLPGFVIVLADVSDCEDRQCDHGQDKTADHGDIHCEEQNSGIGGRHLLLADQLNDDLSMNHDPANMKNSSGKNCDGKRDPGELQKFLLT